MAVIISLVGLNVTVPMNCQVGSASYLRLSPLPHIYSCFLTGHCPKALITLQVVGSLLVVEGKTLMIAVFSRPLATRALSALPFWLLFACTSPSILSSQGHLSQTKHSLRRSAAPFGTKTSLR
jgi:hypothetical protein